jgi:predicted RNA-binding protein YlqC (UPF0109 family)
VVGVVVGVGVEIGVGVEVGVGVEDGVGVEVRVEVEECGKILSQLGKTAPPNTPKVVIMAITIADDLELSVLIGN